VNAADAAPMYRNVRRFLESLFAWYDSDREEREHESVKRTIDAANRALDEGDRVRAAYMDYARRLGRRH
jgi:hypothetical protein